jgi:hypothetical protein
MVIQKLGTPYFAIQCAFNENELPVNADRRENEILFQQRYDKSKRRVNIRRPLSSRYQEQNFPHREISPLQVPKKESHNGESESLELA